MDQLVPLATLLAVIALLARVAARYCRFDVPLGWPLGRESRERFWQDAMPWPRGVQEDSDIAWHVPRTASARSAVVQAPPGRPIPPTQPQPRIAGR